MCEGVAEVVPEQLSRKAVIDRMMFQHLENKAFRGFLDPVSNKGGAQAHFGMGKVNTSAFNPIAAAFAYRLHIFNPRLVAIEQIRVRRIALFS
jgi:hypothetical protein